MRKEIRVINRRFADSHYQKIGASARSPELGKFESKSSSQFFQAIFTRVISGTGSVVSGTNVEQDLRSSAIFILILRDELHEKDQAIGCPSNAVARDLIPS
jgi:hypothetical protein